MKEARYTLESDEAIKLAREMGAVVVSEWDEKYHPSACHLHWYHFENGSFADESGSEPGLTSRQIESKWRIVFPLSKKTKSKKTKV